MILKSLMPAVLVLGLSWPVVAQQGAVFPLPDGVQQLTAVDPQNVLIAQTQDVDTGQKGYHLITVRHLYAGGIARLFGGTVIGTQMFVSPAQSGGGFGAPQGSFTRTTPAGTFSTPMGGFQGPVNQGLGMIPGAGWNGGSFNPTFGSFSGQFNPGLFNSVQPAVPVQPTNTVGPQFKLTAKNPILNQILQGLPLQPEPWGTTITETE